MRKFIFSVGLILSLIVSFSVHAIGVSSKFYLNNHSKTPLKVGEMIIAPNAQNVKVYEVKDSAKLWRHRRYDHDLVIHNEAGAVVCKVQEQITTHYAFMGRFFHFGPKVDYVHAWSVNSNCAVNMNNQTALTFGGDNVAVNITYYL